MLNKFIKKGAGSGEKKHVLLLSLLLCSEAKESCMHACSGCIKSIHAVTPQHMVYYRFFTFSSVFTNVITKVIANFMQCFFLYEMGIKIANRRRKNDLVKKK